MGVVLLCWMGAFLWCCDAVVVLLCHFNTENGRKRGVSQDFIRESHSLDLKEV